MSTPQEMTIRICLHGLRPIERTVFGGVIGLSDRKGFKVELETAPENSDVIILDGEDQIAVALVQSTPRIAQRTIWINPPEHLHAIMQLRRPLRWPQVLSMVDDMIGARSPALPHITPEGAARLVVNMTLDQMYSLSEGILRTHIGIAAEFVIEDVRGSIKKAQATGRGQDIRRLFLDHLQQHLPENVDAGLIARQISEAIAQ